MLPAAGGSEMPLGGSREPNLTQILHAVSAGEPQSLDRLVDAVYADLRRVCANELARMSPGGELLLQPTDLVHDVYLRLVNQTQMSWENRAHFFAIAARLIRRVLVDQVRAAHRIKRGGRASDNGAAQGTGNGDGTPARRPARVPLNATMCIDDRSRLDLLALEDALTRLSETDAESARIVEMRFFADLPEEAIGHVLKMSSRTVRRRLSFARAWLFRDIKGSSAGPARG